MQWTICVMGSLLRFIEIEEAEQKQRFLTKAKIISVAKFD